MMRRVIVTAALVLAADRMVVAGPFEDGLAAIGRGAYATAADLFREAEGDDPDAAFYLGLLYSSARPAGSMVISTEKAAPDPFLANCICSVLTDTFTPEGSQACDFQRSFPTNTGFIGRFSEGCWVSRTNLTCVFHPSQQCGGSADGSDVARDDAKSVRWWRSAADRGQVDAMRWLGVMYATGVGVARSYTDAYMWLSMPRLELDAVFRDGFAQSMTDDQIAEAKRMADERSPPR